MEVARVERVQDAAGDSVAHHQLMGTHGVAFHANAKELGFHRVLHEILADLLRAKNRVQRFDHARAGGDGVFRRILIAVRHPVVDHASLAQRLAERFADFAAALAVLDPEIADLLVRAGKGEAVFRVGMGEERGVEVQANLAIFGPIDPLGKILGRVSVAVDLLAVQLRIAGVQAELFAARDQADGLVDVRAQFIAVARAAGVVARCGDAAGRAAAHAFQADDVVALPAVHGDVCFCRRVHGRVHVYAMRVIPFFRNFKSLVVHCDPPYYIMRRNGLAQDNVLRRALLAYKGQDRLSPRGKRERFRALQRMRAHRPPALGIVAQRANRARNGVHIVRLNEKGVVFARDIAVKIPVGCNQRQTARHGLHQGVAAALVARGQEKRVCRVEKFRHARGFNRSSKQNVRPGGRLFAAACEYAKGVSCPGDGFAGARRALARTERAHKGQYKRALRDAPRRAACFAIHGVEPLCVHAVGEHAHPFRPGKAVGFHRMGRVCRNGDDARNALERPRRAARAILLKQFRRAFAIGKEGRDA